MASYRDTEWRKFWMPDANSKECYDCSAKFTAFRRKHHCRLCGQIFCSKCCNQAVPGKIIDCAGKANKHVSLTKTIFNCKYSYRLGELKVCTYCAQIVLSYLKSSDINTDLKKDLESLKDDLSVKLSNDGKLQPTDTVATSVQRKVSIGYQEERLVSSSTPGLSNDDRKQILQQSQSLKTVHQDMVKMLPIHCCGSELVAYIINSRNAANNVQAVAMLRTMIDAGFLIPQLLANQSSDDDMLLEFHEQGMYKLMRIDDVMSHSGTFQLDLDVDASSVHLSRPDPDGELEGI